MTSNGPSSSATFPDVPKNLQTSDSSTYASNRNVQYEEPAEVRPPENQPVRKKSRWKKFKKFVHGQESDWWFASTAIPLLAATIGPLANVLSISALVTSWREKVYINGSFVNDFDGHPFADPRWCYNLNVASLVFGFLGNAFLLFNFTQRVRYLIALPMTIICWYLATGFLIGITASMQIYAPPNRPYETYTQGFWYAVAAAAMYLICSMILMVNMLGYFLGHYPDHFALTDAQRTLILQTMLFFIWLAGGAGVFSRVEKDDGEGQAWQFADSLYFCDVTILTVGFGDLYPTNDVGRGLVFPYSVGGIITLGLVISSLLGFMREISQEKIVQKHFEKIRLRTIDRTVSNSFELQEREEQSHKQNRTRKRNRIDRARISGPLESRPVRRTTVGQAVRRRVTQLTPNMGKPKLLLLREERDRFNAMRRIQASTKSFKNYYSLLMSVFFFLILWLVGAIVFWQCEKGAQGMTYFQALYFCYVSLLTVGYGDLSPKSNAGRCWFVVWSLIAVPTMTILISDMGDTVIGNFKRWSDSLADFTVLPKQGIWRSFLERHPWLLNWLQRFMDNRARKKRLKRGFETGPDETDARVNDPEGLDDLDDAEDLPQPPNIDSLAAEAEKDASGHSPSPAELHRHLAVTIRRVANDMKLDPPKKYSYEEWVEFTRLIRFSRKKGKAGKMEPDASGEVEREEEEEGLVEWDWIGENSPFVSGLTESEFLMERLCESLVRFSKRTERLFEDLHNKAHGMGTGNEKTGQVEASGGNG